MNRFNSWAIANCLLVFLAFAGKSQAFVAVEVELDPYIGTNSIPTCTSTFIKNFESNLTVWVVNATRSISFLSDFNLPGGFHLTYFNNATRRVRERSLLIKSLCTCTSTKCSSYCSIGTCSLCAKGRRRLTSEAVAFGDEHEQVETSNAALVGFSGEDEPFEQDHLRGRLRRRADAVSWASVGASVATLIRPYVIYFAASHANNCVGESALLAVNVTFHSDVPIDTTMGNAIVKAFGVPASPPANAPTACCSYNFMNCVTYCGTTEAQCRNCSVPTVGWMWNGPVPNGTCTKRWNSCSKNTTSCCKGLQCIGDSSWKGCFYVPPS